MSGIGTLEDLLNKLAAKPKDIELTFTRSARNIAGVETMTRRPPISRTVMMLDLGTMARRWRHRRRSIWDTCNTREKNYTAAIEQLAQI